MKSQISHCGMFLPECVAGMVYNRSTWVET
jgi:hypothetical protein